MVATQNSAWYSYFNIPSSVPPVYVVGIVRSFCQVQPAKHHMFDKSDANHLQVESNRLGQLLHLVQTDLNRRVSGVIILKMPE